MDLGEFLRRRTAEQDWAYANGFNNGDPETNGEFACLASLLKTARLFLDIGANTGEFVEQAIRHRPDVSIVAFEPNPDHEAQLRHRLAPCGGHLESVAIGEVAGEAVLHVHRLHHATASLSGRPRMTPRFRDGMREVRVPVRRLDDLVGGLSTDSGVLLKIDVEGYEFPVLRSAPNLLSGCDGMAIMFEYSFAWQETGEELFDCFQFLDAGGFDVYRVLPLGLEQVRFFTADMERIQYCNFVALKNVPLDAAVDLPTAYGRTAFHPFAAAGQS